MNIPAITELVGEIRCNSLVIPEGMKGEIGETHQTDDARLELQKIRTHTYLVIRPLTGKNLITVYASEVYCESS